MEIRSTYAIASRNLGFSFRFFFFLMWSERKIFYPPLDTRRGSSPPSPPAATGPGWLNGKHRNEFDENEMAQPQDQREDEMETARRTTAERK